MSAQGADLVCGFCGQAPEKHGDSDAGPMSVCPARTAEDVSNEEALRYILEKLGYHVLDGDFTRSDGKRARVAVSAFRPVIALPVCEHGQGPCARCGV